MSKWVRDWDDETFDSEEEAREDAATNVEYEDLEDLVNYEVSLIDIIKELQRLDSPLFYRLFNSAVEQYFKDNYYEATEEEAEEEEEDSFHESYPYTETKPKAFY